MPDNALPFAAARAHANIALIKYWGKRDEKLILPISPSLSLTLDSLYTDTALMPSSDGRWHFVLDGQEQGGEALKRVVDFARIFPVSATAPIPPTPAAATPLTIISHNHVPTAAGLASSSSAFAALAWALRDYFGLAGPGRDGRSLSDQALSACARQGSGSATRSIFGGFVEWTYGQREDGADSFALPVDDGKWDLGLIAVALSTGKKKISSRAGMKHTAETSAFYPLWRQASERDLQRVLEGIANRDVDLIGQAMEANAMKFHATMFSADPPLTYLTARSWEVIEFVWAMRQEGVSAYFTMDAGPNVKILCRKSQMEEISRRLRERFPQAALFQSTSGSGPISLDFARWSQLYGEPSV